MNNESLYLMLVHNTEFVVFMEKRLEVVRADYRGAIENISAGSSADYVHSVSSQMFRADGAESELVVLLRVAHGMNPNGQWPHPVGTCIRCGRVTLAYDILLCDHSSCVKKRAND